MKNNWQTKKLGELCDILDSKRKPVTQKDRVSGEFPYYGATGILDYVDKYIFNEKLVLIGEDGAKWGQCEKTAFITDGKYWVNNHAHVLRPHRDIVLDEWIVYFINFSDLSKYITGVTVPKLNQQKLRSIEIPLPPLSEQKQIVKILDEAFEKLEKAKEKTEKNLQDSKELFESYLNDIFYNSGKGWKAKKIGQICKVIAGQSPEGKFYNKLGQGLPFYQGKKDFGEKFIEEPTVWTTQVTKEAEKGDILMSVRAPVGPTNFATENICIGRGLAAIRAGNEINKDFLFYFFKMFEDQLIGNSGAVFNSINKTQIESIEVPVPSLAQQKVIVKKMNQLSEKTQRLEFLYKQKLENIEELKKSILQKAFSGGL